MSEAERVRRLSLSQQRPTCTSISALKKGQNTLNTRSRPSITREPSLPQFFRPLPRKMDTVDIEYLTRKGALILPPQSLRTELIRCFVQYVYPYMPLLDLHDFLPIALQTEESQGNMSLLLYQAVMFVGASFVNVQHLHAAGFSTRKAARKTFFQRTRVRIHVRFITWLTRYQLLYDFDYESDRITLIQALLLLTYWYETPEDQKDTWHWMGVSLSIAHTIGLHRDLSNSSLSDGQKRLWKRIWWSLFMRDRLIALGMRRPTRVQNAHCNVPMLTPDDFETGAFPAEIIQALGSFTILQNEGHMTQLALMCIEKAKLCRTISHVMSTQYSILGTEGGNSRDTTIMLVPRPTEPNDLLACDTELEEWYDNLSPEVQYDSNSSNDEEPQTLFVHRALLKMMYLTTLSALHRPQVLPANPAPSVDRETMAHSRVKVRDAAVEITDIAHQLQIRDLVRFLPTVGVTVLLPAVIIHLLDIKSSDEELRTASLSRFYQCMQVLTGLREMYASADFATVYLEAAIKKANLSFPAMPSTHPQQHHRPEPNLSIVTSPDLESFAHQPTAPSISTLTPPPDNALETIPLPVLPSDPTTGGDNIIVGGPASSTTPPASSHSGSSSSGNDNTSAYETAADDFSILHDHHQQETGKSPYQQHNNAQQTTTAAKNPHMTSDLDPLLNLDIFETLVASPDLQPQQPRSQFLQNSSTTTSPLLGMMKQPDDEDYGFGFMGMGGAGGSGGNTSALVEGGGGESTGAFGFDLDMMIDMKALDGMTWL